MSEGIPDMGNQHRLSSRAAAAVVACTAAAALTLAGCGSGSAQPRGSATPKPGAVGHAGSAGKDSSAASSEPTRALARLTGEKDVVVTIDKAVRDPGGFVTVSG